MTSKFIAILILFCFIGTVFSSQVKDNMENIEAETGIINLYRNSDNYTRRYILKYLPEWIENRDISGPSIFYSIIEDALLADNCYLVEEAVILVGKYQMESSFDELDDLYKDIMSKFPAHARYIRLAILNALADAPAEVQNSYLIKFIGYQPIGFIKTAFSRLVYCVSLCCDQTAVPILVDYKNEINNIISQLDLSESEEIVCYKKEYENILVKLDKACELIEERN